MSTELPSTSVCEGDAGSLEEDPAANETAGDEAEKVELSAAGKLAEACAANEV